ncbi:Alpha/beta hydrolase fold-1 [Xylogone sp. PMI_703]|nr:Alpha/beta hydrolase fold-1 [Xylogone sp. PMI_703]
MAKPEFVLVPGAWHSGETYKDLVESLSKNGYVAHSITLPSVGTVPPPKDFLPDVKTIRDKIQSILDNGKDVILVVHSYGGVPGSEAMKYFTHQRKDREGKGKVKRLVYMTAMALHEGDSLAKRRNYKDADWWDVQEDCVYAKNTDFMFYNDMPADLATKHSQTVKHHAYRSFYSELTYAPYKDIPTMYIQCEQDQTIPIALQKSFIERAKASAPTAMDIVDWLDAGHSPFLSMPDSVADCLVKAAEKS